MTKDPVTGPSTRTTLSYRDGLSIPCNLSPSSSTAGEEALQFNNSANPNDTSYQHKEPHDDNDDDDDDDDYDDPIIRTSHNGDDDDNNKLVIWQGIALLTADCMGVGVLALPNDIHTLGWAVGIGFLLINLPINYYAGNLLAVLALDLEDDHHDAREGGEDNNNDFGDDGHINNDRRTIQRVPTQDQDERPVARRNGKLRVSDMEVMDDENVNGGKNDKAIIEMTNTTPHNQNESPKSIHNPNSISLTVHRRKNRDTSEGSSTAGVFRDESELAPNSIRANNENDRITLDLINMSKAIFSPTGVPTFMVKAFYYTNLFLVLGDYILVMARAVSAMFLDQICLPTAGAIATVLMFGLCQYRSMANLGRSVSLASLLALLLVLLLCLFHHRTVVPLTSTTSSQAATDRTPEKDGDDDENGIWGKFSSLAGIGFAVGSQKLFLNIRHELRHREESSKVLAGSLTSYGFAYIIVIILAGPDPPSFLFDSIPEGWTRRIAGFLLWFHVAVSYAINSQALCASLDQGLMLRTTAGAGHSYRIVPCWWYNYLERSNPARRWLGLTLVVSVSSYLVANAIPFFKDLVGLIGALTSVPLTLTLPALLYRKAQGLYVLLPGRYCESLNSYALFVYSMAFLGIGLVGAISSIDNDWMNHGSPFSCR